MSREVCPDLGLYRFAGPRDAIPASIASVCVGERYVQGADADFPSPTGAPYSLKALVHLRSVNYFGRSRWTRQLHVALVGFFPVSEDGYQRV